MKKLIVKVFSVAALAALFTGCATSGAKDVYDIKPAEKIVETSPTLVGWQQGKTREQLSAATTEAELAKVVQSEQGALALLAEVKSDYKTDTLAASKIAAVSQYVLGKDRLEARKTWVKALLTTAEKSENEYVQTFCLDQLRWCGCACPEVVRRLQAIAAKGGKEIKNTVEIVITSNEKHAKAK